MRWNKKGGVQDYKENSPTHPLEEEIAPSTGDGGQPDASSWDVGVPARGGGGEHFYRRRAHCRVIDG